MATAERAAQASELRSYLQQSEWGTVRRGLQHRREAEVRKLLAARFTSGDQALAQHAESRAIIAVIDCLLQPADELAKWFTAGE